MAAHDRIWQSGCMSEAQQFARLKARLDGSRAVVKRNGMPAEQPPGGRQRFVRKAVPLQVGHNDRTAGQVMHPPEELLDLAFGKVVQKQRAKHKIELRPAKRQGEGIGHNALPCRLTGVDKPVIQQCHPRSRKMPGHLGAVVAGAAPNFQKAECLLAGHLFGKQLPQQPMASKPAVDLPQVAKTVDGLVRRAAVQEFRAAQPMGDKTGGQGPSHFLP